MFVPCLRNSFSLHSLGGLETLISCLLDSSFNLQPPRTYDTCLLSVNKGHFCLCPYITRISFVFFLLPFPVEGLPLGTHLNHLDLANEVVASTASPQGLRFEGCSPLTSVKITDLLKTFICCRCLLLALLNTAELVDLWMAQNTDLMFTTRVFR